MHLQERRLPEEEHMPREAEHNKLEPGHNTLLEEVYNIQPEGKHKRLVVAHRLVLVDTVAVPGNFPGDKQVELRLH
jgi:hypothetical protein